MVFSASDFAPEQPRLLQHLEVLGDGGQRCAEGSRELGHRRLTLTEPAEQGPAGGVGKGVKDLIEPRRTVNHMVKYH